MSCIASCIVLVHYGTSDDGEHGMWLVQREGQTQGLQVLLLMEKVGKLLLPARDTAELSAPKYHRGFL